MKARAFVLLSYFGLIFGAIILTQIRNGLPRNPGPTRLDLKVGRETAAVHLAENYGRLPLSFEACFEINCGPADPGNSTAKFLSRGKGYTLLLTSAEAVLRIQKPGVDQSRERKGATTKPYLRDKLGPLASARGSDWLFRERTKKPEGGSRGREREPGNRVASVSSVFPVPYSKTAPSRSRLGLQWDAVLSMRLVGGNPAPQVTGMEELPGKNNYFIGNDPSQWRTNIPTYAKVKYRDVYPGVDLIYYGNHRQLEYDLVVSPGANPRLIQLDIQGADKLLIDAQGALALRAGGEELRLHKPLVYQEAGGLRREIAGGYVLRGGHQVGFQVAAYDVAKPLVIDPVLLFSTYLGGSGEDVGNGIAVDSSGNVYVIGATGSSNFPTKTSLQGALGGGTCGAAPNSLPCPDVFVTKLNPGGTALLYSTYLGGSGDDEGASIAVDSSGTAYVAGLTNSTNFPTASPLQAVNGGDFDVFVARLNANGSALVFSTYLGGPGSDVGEAIAIDSSGDAYVTGFTASDNFPTTNPLQPLRGGGLDAFVAKLNPTGSMLVYSTYLGGVSDDEGIGIAADSTGNAYVDGLTQSINFPTLNPMQSLFGGGTCGTSPNQVPCPDGFVTKLNSTGSALVYSTYLGGSGDDEAFGIAVDSSGDAYVTGFTNSTDFPTAAPLQAVIGGGFDAFVAKFNPGGSALLYSTYLGGVSTDRGFAIAVDSSGNAYVTGRTGSNTFPTVNSLQSRGGSFDAFVTKLNPAGSALLYSTYLGGNDFDSGGAIAVDSAGNAYVTGFTGSADFPTANPFQGVFGGGSCGAAPLTVPCDDAFVAKLVFGPAISLGGVVNSASFIFRAVAAGSVASAFGVDLSTSLPGGVTVRMNGIAAPVISASSRQINFQVPWELSGQSQASLTVTVGGFTTSPVVVPLASYGPGLFSTNAAGSGQGAILNANSASLAAPVGLFPASRPARRGESVSIFCTGLGLVANQPPTGVAASDNPPSTTTTFPTVTIGGVAAQVSFSGLAPDFFGLYQVNVEVPANSPTGSAVPVLLSIGGVTSNSVILAVQ